MHRRNRMKKMMAFLLACATLVSCVSAPESVKAEPVDRGYYNPDNADIGDFATLYIHPYLQISKVDNAPVGWSVTDAAKVAQIVRLAPGTHTLAIRYDTGKTYVLMPSTVIVLFQAGKEYSAYGVENAGRIEYQVEEKATGLSAKLDLARLQGGGQDALSSYIKYVLNPTSDETGKTVVMENNQWKLVFRPDLVFELLHKESGELKVGRRGFQMEFDMTGATLYLLVTDLASMSREQFLDDSDYVDTAQFVMLPVQCTSDSVTYKIEKGMEILGDELTLRILVE